MTRFRLAIVLAGTIALTSTAPLMSQSSEDQRIRTALEDYVVGWREGNVAKLSDVLAAEGTVMWLSGNPGQERLNTRSFAEILKQRRPQPEFGLEWRVESLDVLDQRLAIAKVWISRAGGHYVDCLTLQKIAGRWQIVNKTYVMR